MFGVQLQVANQVGDEILLNAVLGLVIILMFAGFFNLGKSLVRKIFKDKKNSHYNVEALRARFTFWYAGSRWAIAQEVIAALMSTASCVIFVVLTVQVQNVEKKASDTDADGNFVEWDSAEYNAIFKAPWLIWTEFFISLYFGFEYCLEFFMATRRFAYIFSVYALIDQITVVPAINAAITGTYFYGFQFLRFVRILKSLLYLRNIGWSFLSGVAAQAALLVIVILSVFFASAGFIFIAENNVVNQEGLVANFLDAIYFIIVSFTTVGYGDISPKSDLGKVVVMAMIIIGIAVVPNQLDRLLTLTRESRDRGHRWFREEGHVVLYSHVSQVIEFFREFYHEDHGRANIQSVLLLPGVRGLPREVEIALAEPAYHYRVQHLYGSAMNVMDLRRSNLSSARHVFLLADRYAANPDEEDARVIVEAFAMRKFHPGVSMSVQILDAKHRESLQDADIQHLMCVNELRMGMLAQSVFCPGFSTFVTNLVRSVSDADLAHIAHHAEHHARGEKQVMGLPQSYIDGLGRELYLIRDMTPYANLSFSESALIMYSKYKVLLLAVTPRPKTCSVDADDNGVEMLAASLISSVAGGNAVNLRKEELVVNPGHGFEMPDQQSAPIYGIIIGNDASDVTRVQSFHQGQLNEDVVLQKLLKTFKKHRGSSDKMRQRREDLLAKTSPFRPSHPEHRDRLDVFEENLRDIDPSSGPLTSTRALFGETAEECDDHEIVATNSVGTPREVAPNGMVEAWPGGKHVLVLGDSATDIVAFVEKFRSYDVKHQKPILIVTPTGLPEMEAAQLMRQPRIFQMLGRPTDMHDLYRAGVELADNVVILGSSSNEDASVDAQSIVAYRLAKRGTAFPIVDLAFAQNSAYLGPLATASVNYLENPYYAAGQMYASTCLDTLLCQTYYEEYQLQTVRSLLSGQAFSICIEDHVSECIGQPMSVLFDALLRSDLLTIGLYRRHPESPLRFVITVPDPDLVVEQDDIVYVLNHSHLSSHVTGGAGIVTAKDRKARQKELKTEERARQKFQRHESKNKLSSDSDLEDEKSEPLPKPKFKSTGKLRRKHSEKKGRKLKTGKKVRWRADDE